MTGFSQLNLASSAVTFSPPANRHFPRIRDLEEAEMSLKARFGFLVAGIENDRDFSIKLTFECR